MRVAGRARRQCQKWVPRMRADAAMAIMVKKWLSDDGVANALGRGRINEAGKGWLGLDGKRASGAA